METLSANPEIAPFQINVLPLEAEEFSPSQPSGQLQVVDLKYPTLPAFPQEGCQLCYQQGFHFPVFIFRGRSPRRIGEDDLLLLGQL